MSKLATHRAHRADRNKDASYGHMDLGRFDSDLRAVDPSDQELVGSLDWLLGSVDIGGGGIDDWAADTVADQTHPDQSLDFAKKLDDAALSYGSTQDGGRDYRIRGLKERDLITIQDIVGGDEDAMFLAVHTHKIVERALTGVDPWAMQWIFGREDLEHASIPTRSMVLEFFEARPVVLQTRIQYQMWRDATKFSMKFECSALDRTFLWQLSRLLNESVGTSIEHGMTIMAKIWANPGIVEAALWKLYCEEISNSKGLFRSLTPNLEAFQSALVFLEIHYLASKNVDSNGWYLTGRNPMRQVEEMRRDLKRVNFDSARRGWSTWW